MTTDHQGVSRAGLVRVAALALLWGSSFLWIKLALRGFNPVQIVFGRLLLGFAVLAPIALSRGLRFPRQRRTWAHLFAAALVANAVPYVLFGIGEETVGSNVAGVLNATTLLWTLLLAFLVGVDRAVTAKKAAGIVLGFLGVVVIFSPWRSAGEIASWGGLACLAAAASYGVGYVYMGRFLTGRGIPPLMLSASQLGAATVLLAIAMPFAGLETPTWRIDAVASLLVLGALGTGAAYVLNYRIIDDEGPTAASAVTYLLPIVAIVFGWLFLREAITAAVVVGIVLVLAGITLSKMLRTAGHPRRTAPD
ncbi:Permease of the drug/metabolite transporter (DMT) superfamily [Micromonospora haikouensis]|uniref:Permease of the drug/metabolite transporter (DMT) superfamily n=1 Tax=Micromonospora haikouensis TaxID=686309 RepID=A0A1C4UNC7_9ACTN|nr:DMT family transporter [Micromonospora haikouensis]SCE73233.1 Permease of the drug/metabolite transporter (DMT) superfamily [Micromonospora haikouensis]